MVRNTLIKHKETIIIYEESGSVIINYNALISHPTSKLVAQLVITYTTAKQQLTCSNCGKTSHSKETCHNRKRKELTVHVSTKVAKLVVGIIAQPVKQAKVP